MWSEGWVNTRKREMFYRKRGGTRYKPTDTWNKYTNEELTGVSAREQPFLHCFPIERRRRLLWTSNQRLWPIYCTIKKMWPRDVFILGEWHLCKEAALAGVAVTGHLWLELLSTSCPLLCILFSKAIFNLFAFAGKRWACSVVESYKSQRGSFASGETSHQRWHARQESRHQHR